MKVRDFLKMFQCERRGSRNVERINHRLKKKGIVTEPGFDHTHIDAEIEFKLAPVVLDSNDAGPDAPATHDLADPSIRVGQLEAANRPPTVVGPDETIPAVLTVMVENGFSRLPIMQTERKVLGVVTLESIASKAVFGSGCSVARECAGIGVEVDHQDVLLQAVPTILENGYVLVRGAKEIITGLVTASDLAWEFGCLAEPFLLIGEIESQIRNLISRRFTLEELRAAKAPGDEERIIQTPHGLTFGEYVRLLESPASWCKLESGIDRGYFIASLKEANRVRNEVMHFDPDGISKQDLVRLRSFASFFRQMVADKLL